MQSIETKYYGPTNARGSRIRAMCQARKIFIPWDPGLDVAANHREAARKLATDLGWGGWWVGGGLPSDDGYAFVCVDGRTIGPDFNVVVAEGS